MAKQKWEVYNFYATHSRKVVEAETEEEARNIADCIGWNEDQVLGKCEWTGSEVHEADADEDLTDLTDDDKRMLARYREHQREVARGGA